MIIEPGGYHTPLYSRLVYPADTARVNAYGPLGEMPAQIFGGFAQQLQGPEGPDPQDVADAIARLVETPAGQRPLRTVVDPFTADGVTALAKTSQQVQERVFGFFGLSDLLTIGAGSSA